MSGTRGCGNTSFSFLILLSFPGFLCRYLLLFFTIRGPNSWVFNSITQEKRTLPASLAIAHKPLTCLLTLLSPASVCSLLHSAQKVLEARKTKVNCRQGRAHPEDCSLGLWVAVVLPWAHMTCCAQAPWREKRDFFMEHFINVGVVLAQEPC